MPQQNTHDPVISGNTSQGLGFRSRLSFRPLVREWEKKVKEGQPGIADYYRELVTLLNARPELLRPVEELAPLHKNEALINRMMATLFPVTLDDKKDLYAVTIPFTYDVVYASQRFRAVFVPDDTRKIRIQDSDTLKNISKERIAAAYQLILAKFYQLQLPSVNSSIHPYREPDSGRETFMELEIDNRFVEVFSPGPLPELPEYIAIQTAEDILNSEELQELLPLDQFQFEGLMLVQVKDVTTREIIRDIKESLIVTDAFTEVENFEKLRGHVQNLVGLEGLRIGITPFFRVNGQSVFPPIYESTSLLLAPGDVDPKKDPAYRRIMKYFQSNPHPLLVPRITEATLKKHDLVEQIYKSGGRSALVHPLVLEKQLLGTLEVVSDHSGQLNSSILKKLTELIPLFALSLDKSSKLLEAQVNTVIKEQFTAVQSAVEWRFTEAALNYISEAQVAEDAKIEHIVFHDVYPLYGAIDIRNSTGERNQAIQKDLHDQLQAIQDITRKALEVQRNPVVEIIDRKASGYMDTIRETMHSDDEFEIHSFFKKDVKELFYYLRRRIPALQEDITEYFSIVDSDTKTWNQHRKEFEESITFINNTIAHFIDREQRKAQQIFPHYFERFVTDGIDFNMYIGQSIAPERKLTAKEVEQLKRWQINLLARAALLGKRLEKKSPVPLQTTQLILAQNQPISISFRPAERKFDVDGAYNIRYEIIKKRIDKVHIKGNGERLTQPGTLAIVYTLSEEAAEYRKLIEELQQQGLFLPTVDEFELEELQGVIGLKALRVQINPEEPVFRSS